MDIQFFVDLAHLVRKNILMENDNIENRDNIIGFMDIMYCICFMSLGNSYSITNMNMRYNNILTVTNSALAKKRNSIEISHFKLINDNLLKYIYSSGEKRIIGVDGTHIPLSIKLKEHGFKSTINDNYCNVLVSSLFDVENEIVINYNLCNLHNERLGLLEQTYCMRKGDTLLL